MNKNVLIAIDIQKEYNTPGRAFYIPEIAPSLQNCKTMLKHAREKKWPIIHVKHLQKGEIFSAANQFSEFISGFEPMNGELEITKSNFSCFFSDEFTQAMSKFKDACIHVIGYGSTMCYISTIVDGYHRGYKMKFVSDASNAKPTSNFSSSDLHSRMIDVISTFSDNVLTSDVSI